MRLIDNEILGGFSYVKLKMCQKSENEAIVNLYEYNS